METNQVVRLHAVPHPSAPVRQAGFPLDHPYIEQCWAPVIGPTSVLLLRRLPVLWRENLSVEVSLEELAGSLGLGRSTERNGSLHRTLDRLVRFRFAAAQGPADLAVFTEAPPVPARQLDRLPSWCRSRHTQLLGAHLDGLTPLHATPASPTNLAARPTASADPSRASTDDPHRALFGRPHRRLMLSPSPGHQRRPDPPLPRTHPCRYPSRGTCGPHPQLPRAAREFHDHGAASAGGRTAGPVVSRAVLHLNEPHPVPGTSPDPRSDPRGVRALPPAASTARSLRLCPGADVVALEGSRLVAGVKTSGRRRAPYVGAIPSPAHRSPPWRNP